MNKNQNFINNIINKELFLEKWEVTMFGKKKEKACKNCSNIEAGREASTKSAKSSTRNCEAGKEASRKSSSRKSK